MRINVSEPLTQRQAGIGILLCILAMVGIVVGMHYLKPILDAKNIEMQERKQAIEKQFFK